MTLPACLFGPGGDYSRPWPPLPSDADFDSSEVSPDGTATWEGDGGGGLHPVSRLAARADVWVVDQAVLGA